MNFNSILEQYKDYNPVLIKEGGQKVVYKMFHPEYKDSVLKLGTFESKVGLERITREIEVLRNIDSDYYPKNYSFDLVGSNYFVIIEEFIKGQPLTNIIDNYCNSVDVIRLVDNLCNGLNLLWEQRIIHRDIKPDNLIIRSNDYPVIIDLGIARLLDRTSLTHSLLNRGPCTPVYAAIEQLTNRKTEIDWRTDQFALGIVMVQLLNCGKHPFSPEFIDQGSDTVSNIINGKYSLGIINKFDNGIRSLAVKMLGKEPFQRFRTFNQLKENLNFILEEL